MEVNCAQVWIVLSTCLEDNIEAAVPYAIEEHIWSCRRCVSVLQACEMVSVQPGIGVYRMQDQKIKTTSLRASFQPDPALMGRGPHQTGSIELKEKKCTLILA
jgi:hypothetical protein